MYNAISLAGQHAGLAGLDVILKYYVSCGLCINN